MLREGAVEPDFMMSRVDAIMSGASQAVVKARRIGRDRADTRGGAFASTSASAPSLSRTGLSSTQPSGTRTATMFRLNVIFSPSGIDIAFALDASQTSGKHSRNGRWCEAGG